ncbi:hypothetical protein Godav_029207 [Gossypium davidsonii]|uniref:Uncharacterized protein n=1 Tax=Gossypium davidsonii TaxID=34287 RepID=A0A7J8TED5_GOSDV|nr:hypothetical protein [Gossypium davidsonii]
MAGARRERNNRGSLSPRTAGRPIPRRGKVKVAILVGIAHSRRKGFAYPGKDMSFVFFVVDVHQWKAMSVSCHASTYLGILLDSLVSKWSTNGELTVKAAYTFLSWDISDNKWELDPNVFDRNQRSRLKTESDQAFGKSPIAGCVKRTQTVQGNLVLDLSDQLGLLEIAMIWKL